MKPTLTVILLIALAVGCKAPKSTPGPDVNTIPNFSVFEPSRARGGQPKSDSDWLWLVAHGYTNDVKLDTQDESSDDGATKVGMTIFYAPIDTMQQITTGPTNMDWVVKWLALPGTFVHCQHGKDRTGLAVGCYRLAEGTNKAAAYQEMMQHGFHSVLYGLQHFWDKQ